VAGKANQGAKRCLVLIASHQDPTARTAFERVVSQVLSGLIEPPRRLAEEESGDLGRGRRDY